MTVYQRKITLLTIKEALRGVLPIIKKRKHLAIMQRKTVSCALKVKVYRASNLVIEDHFDNMNACSKKKSILINNGM